MAAAAALGRVAAIARTGDGPPKGANEPDAAKARRGK
jgi:hypothetical protein